MKNSEILLKCIKLGCFKKGNFILKSGKQSNYYIDLRSIISYPDFLKEFCELLGKIVVEKTGNCKKLLCGLPYAGLPYTFGVSMLYNIPMVMLRKEAKKHGTSKMIEGDYQKGEELILIDDILTSGTSIVESLQHLTDFKIDTIIVIVDRCEGGREKLEKMGYKIHSLFTINDFIEA
jgi:uridine monophosphate synthetase